MTSCKGLASCSTVEWNVEDLGVYRRIRYISFRYISVR